MDLVDRLRAGDQSAVSDLAKEHGPRLFQLALRHVKNREDAEEVVQDALLKAYRKIGAFRGDSALSSWLYRITFNTAMSRLRHTRAMRFAEVDEAMGADPVDWSKMADEKLLRGQMRSRLAEAVAGLPQIYREPVILRDFRGLSTGEASSVLNVKDQTLKSRLHRGRSILRKRLAEFANGLSMHRPVEAI